MTEAGILSCLLLLIRHAHIIKTHFARHRLLEDVFQAAVACSELYPGAALPLICADRYSL